MSKERTYEEVLKDVIQGFHDLHKTQNERTLRLEKMVAQTNILIGTVIKLVTQIHPEIEEISDPLIKALDSLAEELQKVIEL